MDDLKLDDNFGIVIEDGDFAVVHDIDCIIQTLKRRLIDSKVIQQYIGEMGTKENAEVFIKALKNELNFDGFFDPGELLITLTPISPNELYMDVYYNHPTFGTARILDVSITFEAGKITILTNKEEESNLQKSYNNNKYLQRGGIR